MNNKSQIIGARIIDIRGLSQLSQEMRNAIHQFLCEHKEMSESKLALELRETEQRFVFTRSGSNSYDFLERIKTYKHKTEALIALDDAVRESQRFIDTLEQVFRANPPPPPLTDEEKSAVLST